MCTREQTQQGQWRQAVVTQVLLTTYQLFHSISYVVSHHDLCHVLKHQGVRWSATSLALSRLSTWLTLLTCLLVRVVPLRYSCIHDKQLAVFLVSFVKFMTLVCLLSLLCPGMLSRVVPLRRSMHDKWLTGGRQGPGVYPVKLIIMSATLRTEDFTGNKRWAGSRTSSYLCLQFWIYMQGFVVVKGAC